MMRKQGRYGPVQRLLAFALALVMVLGYVPQLPVTAKADQMPPVTTMDDPLVDVDWLDDQIYGTNTRNAGKVTVDKNVIADGNGNNASITLSNGTTLTPSTDNFLVMVSQSAQTMALSSEIPVPIDAVFVLDTSGSMNQGGNNPDRASKLVQATNSAIASLMAANLDNRVGVVAFSSENYGRGTSNYAAANVLSDLAHYSDAAATQHLTLQSANNGIQYVVGRKTNAAFYSWREDQNGKMTTDTGRGFTPRSYNGGYAARDAHNGGTNIQAGIVEGAKLLTSVSADDTTVTYGSGASTRTVTRMPVLIIVSDGNPTFMPSDSTWYAPVNTGEVGPGSAPYEGEAFMTALTAAYYKGVISEHYYGRNASAEQHCSVYTVGVDITTDNNYMTADEMAQAEFALDPATNAVSGVNNYYTYGNSWNANAWNRDTDYAPETYWNNYSQDNAGDFDVRVNNNQYYEVTGNTITATRNYVNGYSEKNSLQMYTGGIKYNDEYFSASNSDLNDQFSRMILKLQLKAMTVPTLVNEYGEDFSGYVTFTDVIGEFMEVKDMKGIYADGVFYRGASAARYLASGSNSEFNAKLKEVMQTRFTMDNNSSVDLDAMLAAARNSPNQAYWNSATDYDNSLVWWGRTYDMENGVDKGVQCLGFADNDTIEFIKESAANGTIPAGADVVGRSYYFYGTAGGTVANPNHEYLYFVIRVTRSLHAPYQQTVTVSAPASLLSVDKVLITEKLNANGTTSYTAMVEDAEVARVIYEVGLRSDINAQNVASVVAAEMPAYVSEKPVDGEGSANYTDDTYHFFTNDWHREETLASHERAMSKAVFDTAADNDFYVYQKDTLLVDANGNPLTAIPADGIAYVARDVYTWTPGVTNNDGTYPAQKSADKDLTLVKVQIPYGSSAVIRKDDEYLYIVKGTHAESTLASFDRETMKTDNTTGTAATVRHPQKTEQSIVDSHYTVLLGNNGKLSLTYDPPKTVSIQSDANGSAADGQPSDNDNGETVMVGQYLEYKIDVTNNESDVADILVTDKIPAGTAYVDTETGSAASNYANTDIEESRNDNGTPDDVTDDYVESLEWTLNDVPAGETYTVSFKVQVTEDAVSVTDQIGSISNTANIKIGNNPSYTTNTTNNPPEGKTVTDGDSKDLTGDVQVGDELTYYIQWVNDETYAADVTITDKIPAGTTFHSFTGIFNTVGLTPVKNEETGVTTWTKTTGEGEEEYILTHTPATGDQPETLKWQLMNRAAGSTGYVSFKVIVDASAKDSTDEDTQLDITNFATIQIGENDPGQNTNPVTVKAGTGAMSFKKVTQSSVTGVGAPTDAVFTFLLEDPTHKLSGTYTMTKNGVPIDGGVTFTAGKATIPGVKHGDVYVIDGLPLGTEIHVTEEAVQDWIMNCTTCGTGTTFKTSVVIAAEETDEGGNVVASATGNAANVDVEITNCYHPTPVTFQLKGTKKYVGPIPEGTVFTFKAEGYVMDTTSGKLVSSGRSATATVKREALTEGGLETSDVFSFTPRDFYEEATYYYLITEEAIANTSMVMAQNEYMLRLEIKKVDGVLTAIASISETKDEDGNWINYESLTWETDFDDVTFTNIQPTPAEVTLSATKQLTNRLLQPGDTFAFALYDRVNSKHQEAQILVTEDSSSGTTSFAPLTFTMDHMAGADRGEDGKLTKTLTYWIYERDTNIPNIAYDTSYYQVDIKLTLNEETGALEHTVSYTKYKVVIGKDGSETYAQDGDSVTFDEDDALEFPFTNVYTDGATLTLKGTKIVQKLADVTVGNFAFGIFEKDSEGQYTVPVAGSVYDASNGSITFGDLDYTLEDFEGDDVKDLGNGIKSITRDYRIREIIPVAGDPTFDPFMDYDEKTYDIKVTVTYNTVTGIMEATVTDGTTNNYSFENIRYPSTVKVAPEGTKSITGANVPDGLSFSFDVYSAEVNDVTGAVTKGTLEGTGTSQATGSTVNNGGNSTSNASGTPEDLDSIGSSDGDNGGDTTPDGGDDNTTPEGGDDNITPLSGDDDTTSDGGDDDTTPEGSDDDTAPDGGDDNTTSDGGDDNTTPDGGDDDTTSDGGDDDTTPDGSDDDTAPDGGVVDTTPDGSDDDTAPDGGDDDTTSDGGDDNTTPDGSDDDTIPDGGDDNTTSGGDDNTTPDGGIAPLNDVDDSTSTVTGLTIGFTELVFDLGDVGTNYFLIEEIPVSGIDCDETKYLMAVEVTHSNGQLSAKIVSYQKLKENGDHTKLSDYESYWTFSETDPTPIAVAFSNTYDSTSNPVNLTALKHMYGRTLGDKEFEFVLKDASGDIVSTGNNAVGTEKTDENGKKYYEGTVNFGSLTFTNEMLSADTYDAALDAYLFTYTMEEVKPASAWIPGVSYDTEQHTIVIKVVQTGTALTASLYKVDDKEVGSPSATGVTFTNTYAPETAEPVTITGNKVLLSNTDRKLEANEFNFNLYRVVGESETLIASTANDANGGFSFTRPYTVEGLSTLFTEGNDTATINYRIREVESNLPNGVSPVNAGYYVDVEVVIEHDSSKAAYTVKSVTYTGKRADTATGIVSKSATVQTLYTADAAEEQLNAGAEVKFYNKYTAASTSVTPAASKELLGAVQADGTAREELDIGAGQFSFQVIELDPNTKNPVQVTMPGTTKEIDKEVASGSTTGTGGGIQFTSIHYTEADMKDAENGEKVFYYEIRETNSGAAGYTYDTTKYYMTVTVTDDGQGQLTVSDPVYYSDNAFAEQMSGAPTFTNYYGPGDIPVNVGAELNLTKTVTVKDADGETITTETYPIKESEFDFILWEAETAADGNPTGEFKNVMEGTTESGSGTAAIRFGTLNFTRADVYGGADQILTTAKSKVFYYKITEKNPNGENVNTNDPMSYDSGTVYFTITVTDDGYGNMTASTAIVGEDWTEVVDGKDSFENTVKYTSTSLTLQAHKTLSNKNLAVNADKFDKFSFELYEGTEKVVTAVNDANGNVVFPDIPYSAPGTHVYTIVETGISQVNGTGIYTTSNLVYTVVVNVTADSSRKLIANPTYYSSYDPVTETGTVAAAPVVFTNSYTPSPITVDLTDEIRAEKTIVDAEGNPMDLSLDGFQFQVTDSSGNPVTGSGGKPITGTSVEYVESGKKVGKINFAPEFKFNASGEYHYYITETGDKAGYINDPATWSVYVLVNYSHETGELSIGEVVTQKVTTAAQDTESGGTQPQASEQPVFTNVYNPVPTKVEIKAEKVLENRDLFGGDFTFYLMNGNIIAAEAHNDVNGDITFTVNYTAKDLDGTEDHQKTFNYTIVEEIPDDAVEDIKNGVEYTNLKIQNVQVTVKDNGGQLSASVAYPSGGDMTFTNEYIAAGTFADIHATKSLTGMNMVENQFSFVLATEKVDGNGEKVEVEVARASNDADGKIIFTSIPYGFGDMLDENENRLVRKEFHYVLFEDPGASTLAEGDAYMHYDTTRYPVTVTVTDDQRGQLHAVVTYGEEGKGAAPIFYNTFHGDAVPVTLSANKALTSTGKTSLTMASDAVNGIFSFQLLDENKNVLQTVTNKAKRNGEGELVDYSAVVFQAITYQDVGEYIYYIREVAGNQAGMTYDATEHKVVVTVTQEQSTGEYFVTVDYAPDNADAESFVNGNITIRGEAPTFTNAYTSEPLKISLEASKVLTGRDLRAGEFSFEVHDSNGTRVAKATNDKDGKILFSDIKLPVAGTYKLTMSEVRGRKLFVTYDKSKYTVTVEVSKTDGMLKVDKITYPTSKVIFKNTYDPSAPALTGDEMPLVLMASIMALSAAAIVTLLVWRKKRSRR